MSYGDWEAVIGLEIHVQLNTDSKLFCGCSTEYGLGDNESTCPVCLGYPGALPVVNEEAIKKAVQIGLALGCEINNNSFFERKNYFYPDLSKGYQISQLQRPINGSGRIEFFVDDVPKTVGINRAHIEEDAGKSIHQSDSSLINYNRAGVPLVEIVSEPEIYSPREAAEYAREIRSIVTFLDANDGNLEEGSFRCDCNVSVRKTGDQKLGTRTELKNINSFRFIEKAVQYEIERQIDVLESGGKIVQETRLYDSTKNQTFTMRSKEEAEDYRYFPDPDLLPIPLSDKFVNDLKRGLPTLPTPRLQALVDKGIPIDLGKTIISEKHYADYFDEVLSLVSDTKLVANWFANELIGQLNDKGAALRDAALSPQSFADLLKLIVSGEISGKIAKTVLEEMIASGKSPQEIVSEKSLGQISNEDELLNFVRQVVADNPKQVQQYLDGKEKVMGFFVGQIMKLTKGQANPALVNKLLLKELKAISK